MPRQILTPGASGGKMTGVAPLNKGGTGVKTANEAVRVLGGLSRDQIGIPLGLVKASARGYLQFDDLELEDGVTAYAITGPRWLLRGATSVFSSTVAFDPVDHGVSITAGSLYVSGREISIVPPDTGAEVTLRIQGRKIVLPIVESQPATPIISRPTDGSSFQGSIFMYTEPFQSTDEIPGSWIELAANSTSTVVFPVGSVRIECVGRCGLSGTAEVNIDGTLYKFGVSETQRYIERKQLSQVIFSAAGEGSLKYRIVTAALEHVATDWELATDTEFANIVRSSIDDQQNLTSWTVRVSPGKYYLRCRHKSLPAF